MAGNLKLISVLLAGVMALFALLVIGGAVLVVVMSSNRQLPHGYKIVYDAQSECSIANSAGQQVVRPHIVQWTTQPNGTVTGQLASGITFTLNPSDGSVSYSDDSADQPHG